MKDVVLTYKKKRSFFLDNKYDLDYSFLNFDIAVGIPIINEYPTFLQTLNSLDESLIFLQNHNIKKNVCVICVINANENSCDDVIKNNQLLFECLNNKKKDYNFTLFILDFFNKEKFLSKDGVGKARKIAMDFAVELNSKIICCLDADTLVEQNYFYEIVNFININSNKKYLFALTNFKHQQARNSLEQEAINLYEQYLIEHSINLKKCNTPFYHVALGPTIICTQESYCACGGMNCKVAGEDFYFLQSLIKNSIQNGNDFFDTAYLLNTTVKPSSRISDRVLFGTGTRIQNIISGDKDCCKIYPKICYDSLQYINSSFEKSLLVHNSYEYFFSMMEQSPKIQNFFLTDNFYTKWQKTARVFYKDKNALRIAFYVYFDGLKIIRLFHHLCNVC